MWNIDTAWFDVAVTSLALVVGNILFGHFEAHRPKYRRLVKAALTITITVTLAQTVGRFWAYGWMVPLLVMVVWIHAVWLPRNGINGLTGEPRDRYLALAKKAKLSDVFSSRPLDL
jgi:fatty acid desaturase